MSQYVSPLDEYMQKNSIMYKGTAGNAYNTTLDEYYIDRNGYSQQYNDENDYGDDGGGNCAPCYNPNPPWWCSDPNHECFDASVPIEPGFIGLVFCFAFGAFLIKNRLNIA